MATKPVLVVEIDSFWLRGLFETTQIQLDSNPKGAWNWSTSTVEEIMRVESLLIIFLWLAPGLAIRGERRPVRDLRGGAEDKDKDVFDSNGDKPKE